MANEPETNVSAIAHMPGDTPDKTRIVNTGVITESLPVGVMVCTVDASNSIECLSINKFARSIFELSKPINLPCHMDSIWNAHESHVLTHQILDVYKNGQTSDFEWNIRKGAVERFVASKLIPIRDAKGKIYQVLCTLEDQTAEKLAEKNLLHHAFHDALTGQPNRVLFRNKLEEAVADCQRTDEQTGCAVLIINIDRFQQINESFGHSAGDRFLISMASTLRRCIRGSDTLARLSGDEFAILVSRFSDIEEVEMISTRIHEAMQQPYDLDNNEVFISVSIGVATTISSATHPEDLIRDADFAMHRAKLAGKARTEIYQRDSHRQARSQFHLETELRRAVERNELDLYYQPIVDLKTAELHAFEALTRWEHKERGFVSPAEFIALAEETGIIVKLGRWAIQDTCRQLRTWIDTRPADKLVPVNVNVSGIQFSRDDVAAVVAEALQQYKIDGELLRIELTESAIMANPMRIAETLGHIRQLGVKIALDDFGTGYSCLNYLHQFPIDIIKIDRSFINQLEKDNEPYKILNMIGLLAKSLGHEIVAEGLEDMDHISMLEEMGFRYGQGFYYSKPVTSIDATGILEGNIPWS